MRHPREDVGLLLVLLWILGVVVASAVAISLRSVVGS